MKLCLLLALAACTANQDKNPVDDSTDTNTETGDSGEPIDTSGDPEILNLSVVTAAQMSTVITVTWDTEDAGESWVEIGPNDSYGYATQRSAGGTHHELIVPGFPFDSDWHWRAVTELGDGTLVASADQEHHSDQQPPGLVDFDVIVHDATQVEPGFRILPYVAETPGILVLNENGALVWQREMEQGQVALEAILSADGTGIYYMLGDVTRLTDIGAIRYERWDLDPTATTEARAVWAHHDFQVLPDGRLAYIAADIREIAGADHEVAGDALVIMDADGSNPSTIWNSWDALVQPNFRGCDPEFYPMYCDWTHANGLWYDETIDGFQLSLHNENSFVQMDMAGNIDWYLGSATYADLQPENPEDEFIHQHGVKRAGPDSYVLFDNQDYNADWSRMIRVVTDEANGTYTIDWEWRWDERHASILLGDHDMMPAGNHLGSWGSEGAVTETTEDYQLVWEAGFSIGAQSAFVSYAATLGGALP